MDHLDDYTSYLKQNPNRKFSDYYVEKLKSIIAKDEEHTALGSRLTKQGSVVDFWHAGEAEFEQYWNRLDMKPDHRVIDYGCGSLRLGVHLINSLEPGNYYGIDLTHDFLPPGIKALCSKVGGIKESRFGLIPKDLGQAENHNTDFVISSNVAYHVHPDEFAEYGNNLCKLASKKDSVICFDTRVSLHNHQFGDRNFARTINENLDNFDEFHLAEAFPTVNKIMEKLEFGERVVRATFFLKKT